MSSKAEALQPRVDMSSRVRLTLELNPALNSALEELVAQTGGTKSDVLRKAIAIFQVAVRANREGKRFGVAAEGQELATEIVGI
jgi:hypothetical protein